MIVVAVATIIYVVGGWAATVDNRCGNCGALLYTNGTCPNCDRPKRSAA